MKRIAKLGPLTLALVGVLLTFAGGDALANLTGYKYGETVSKLIEHTQKVHPAFRVAVTGFLLYLIGHLELGWPL